MHFCCRAPYGARGLKFEISIIPYKADLSRPVWGAWIEIITQTLVAQMAGGRAPYGARGLKSILFTISLHQYCRAPYGARGLKLLWHNAVQNPTICRAPYGARGLKWYPI